MAQRKLMIELPRSSDALHNLLQMLLQYGLISENKARTIEQERLETVAEPKKTGRWGQAAERLRSENFLKGRSGEVNEIFRECKEDFEL